MCKGISIPENRRYTYIDYGNSCISQVALSRFCNGDGDAETAICLFLTGVGRYIRDTLMCV